MWHLRGTRNKVVDLIVRNFSASELLEARKELCKAVSADDPITRRDSGQRSAAEAYAIDLLDQLGDLDSQGKLPVIVVPSTKLAKVPISTLLTSDDVAVSARLENLEKSIKVLSDAVTKVVVPTSTLVPTPGSVTFAEARARVNSVSQGGEAQVKGVPQANPRIAVGPTMDQSWSGVVGNEGGGGLKVPQVPGRDRLGSDAEKRKREEEFRLPGRQRGRKVAFGKSTVPVDEGGEAAPLDFYVGNTTPRATPEIIKAVLVKSAQKLEKDLQVLEVTCLTHGLDSPRSKSWKIKVPYRFKDLMEQDELYPEGWTYRKFFAPRASNQGKGGPNKKARPDDQLVDEVLQDHGLQQPQVGADHGQHGEGTIDPTVNAGG